MGPLLYKLNRAMEIIEAPRGSQCTQTKNVASLDPAFFEVAYRLGVGSLHRRTPLSIRL